MTDSLNNVVPGTQLTDEQRKQLAADNAKASAEAMRLAADHRARDMEGGGNPATLANDVASSIQKKLENEEYSKPESQ